MRPMSCASLATGLHLRGPRHAGAGMRGPLPPRMAPSLSPEFRRGRADVSHDGGDLHEVQIPLRMMGEQSDTIGTRRLARATGPAGAPPLFIVNRNAACCAIPSSL